MSSLIEKDEIINLQHNEKFQSEVLFDYENILIHLDSLSNNIQKKLIKINPLNILYFKKTSDTIKKIAINNCNIDTISHITKCIIFNQSLYQTLCEKAEVLGVKKLPTLDKINNNFKNNRIKLRISEINEETQETIQYPFFVSKTNQEKWITTNPLSIIRVINPSKTLCQSAVNSCQKIEILNRIIYNIDLKKFEELYLLYVDKYTNLHKLLKNNISS